MRAVTLLLIFCISALAQNSSVTISERPTRRESSYRGYFSSTNLIYSCDADPAAGVDTEWTVAATTLTSIADASAVSTVTTSAAHGLAPGNTIVISGGLIATWVAADITSITDSTNTSTIVFAAAHGLLNSDIITISGMTTDTDLNGTYVFTKSDATIGTITTANVDDQEYNATTDTGMAIAIGDTDLNGTYIVATVASTTTLTVATTNVLDGNFLASGLEVDTSGAPVRDTQAVWSVKRFEVDGSNNTTHKMWADGNSVADNVCADRVTLTYK